MRSELRHQILTALGNWTRPSKRTHFLNGHFVCSELLPIEDQKNIFREFIVTLQKQVSIVDPVTALDNINQKQNALTSLTFDDGYADVFTIITPVLDEFGIKGLFFINPSFLGLKGDNAFRVIKSHYKSACKKDFLTEDEVIDLCRRGHTIGSHTLSHARLDTTENDILEEEIITSKKKIESLTFKPCDWFAYPFGGTSDISEKALMIALANYKYVFSSIKGDNLFSFENRVINRRHFEGNWPIKHLNFFMSGRK